MKADDTISAWSTNKPLAIVSRQIQPFPETTANQYLANEKPVIPVLCSFCDHLRLASLPIEHYDARHIIAVMIAPLQHAPEHATFHRSPAEDCMPMAHIGI
jgi:hypothetical protein